MLVTGVYTTSCGFKRLQGLHNTVDIINKNNFFKKSAKPIEIRVFSYYNFDSKNYVNLKCVPLECIIFVFERYITLKGGGRVYAFFDEFTDYLKETVSTKNTYDAYVRDVFAFLENINASDAAAVKNFSHDDAQKYVSKLVANGKAPSTVSRNIASLRGYYKFLIMRGYAFTNPFVKLEVKKTEKKLPSILTSKEVDKLLAQPDTTTPKGIRDRAMLELLYATGLRVTELIELTLKNVNLELGFLRCGTFDEERIIPIYPLAIKALSAYIDNVRGIYAPENSDVLFFNFSGEPLTRQGFWKIIKQYQKTAGIKTSITPQTLRHSFAAHLVENGADLHDVQEMLGHSDIASTQVYAHFVKNKFKSVYSKYHPRA